MNRILVDFGIFSIYWYSIFILLGVVVAGFIIYKEIIRQNIDKDLISDMLFFMLIFGILGARIYYVLFNFSYYKNNLLEIIQINKGGLAIHGGILAGVLYVIYFTKKHKLDTLKILDILSCGVVIAQSIGRWGNFFNQEAYGRITTRLALENMHIPKFIIDGMYINKVYYTPTFLYESMWNFIGFFILILIRKNKNIKIGMLSGIYLSWYSFGRFFIESLRMDSLMFLNIRVAQVMSVVLFIVGVILIVKGLKSNKYYNNNVKKY